MKYLIILNRRALFNIDNNYNSKLMLLDYDSALEWIKNSKKTNPESNYELISEDDYYKSLEKKLINKEIIKMTDFSNEDPLNKEEREDEEQRTKDLENNINNFKLPIVVAKDCNYIQELEKVLNEYYSHLSNKSAFKNEPGLISVIKDNIEKIIKAVKSYFSGDLGKSKEYIKKILKQYKFDDIHFFISELDKSYAFRGIAPFSDLHASNYDNKYKEMNEETLSFYRARKGNVEKRDEMLHVPFNRRSLIASQRFSIAGIPCIYLGTTSYVCWQELGKPANSDFNVCSYRFNEKGRKLRILNLVISEALINGLSNRSCQNEQGIEKKLQLEMLKIFPLVIATSFTVLEKERSFKSEYIIPQLIMCCLKELNIDGVAYLSKKGINDLQYPHGVNLAIPVFENSKDKKYGDICDKFDLSKPINYETFFNEKELDFGELSYINAIYKQNSEGNVENVISKVHYKGKDVFYGNIKFSDFDNYLVNIERKNYLM